MSKHTYLHHLWKHKDRVVDAGTLPAPPPQWGRGEGKAWKRQLRDVGSNCNCKEKNFIVSLNQKNPGM